MQKYKFASPLRYPGGKTRLASFLSKAIDNNFEKNEEVVLVEPYAGGAGAALALLFAHKVKKIIINDLDKAIYAFWKIAVTDTDYLIRKIEETNVGIDAWEKQKGIYDTKSTDEHKLAFATLFLNRTNRSGIMNGGPIGGKEQKGKWKINARFNKQTIIDRLKKIKEFQKQIRVTNQDGVALLKILENDSRSVPYFVFLDPPYYQKGRSLYLNHHDEKAHQELSTFLETSSLKWIMTYDDAQFIKNLYLKNYTNQFLIHHQAHKSKFENEIMIFSKEINGEALSKHPALPSAQGVAE